MLREAVIVKGVQFSSVASGIKDASLDLGLAFFGEPTSFAAVYTRNKVKAAHVLYNRKKVKGRCEALLVNSSCANACTGLRASPTLAAIARRWLQDFASRKMRSFCLDGCDRPKDARTEDRRRDTGTGQEPEKRTT
jgi:N-acetylglutamate synthase/N-acetylornithine aminotransferase